ncbi:MAG: hypothetical protein ACHQ53_06020 [Polyangiales bacterium]
MIWVVAALAVLACAGHTRADQRRDFMLAIQPTGTFFVADYFGTGAQLTLEHRLQVYGSANDLTVAAAAVPAYPEGDAFARADLRVLFLNFGATIAYRAVWRDLVFDAGKDSYCVRCDRGARRGMAPLFGRTPGTERFPYGEGRVSLLLPFNEYFVGQTTLAARYEGRKDRSFDWYYTSVYDRGELTRFEAELFLKHPRWGGIGPYLQLLELPRAGHHFAQWAFGFNAVTRLGLLPRNDLLFLTFLIRPGDALYGQQSYYAPIRALLVYRMILEL